MRRIIKNILFICACMAAVSCGGDSIDELLNDAENTVRLQPDVALKLLNSIRNPYDISKYQHARLNILTLYAKDLSCMDISKDTAIIYARDYLKKVNSPKYLAYAEYYMGRIHQAQGYMKEALQFYMDAKTSAEKSDDDDIKGLIYSCIGMLHYAKSAFDEAISNFKPALEYFDRDRENYKRKIAVLNNIGNCFLMNKMNDSAMIYYQEAFKLAEVDNDLLTIKRNLGMIYMKTKKFDKARQQLFQALSLNPDSASLASIYANLSNAYKEEEIRDSAIYFAKLSLQFVKSDDNYTLINIYNTLSYMEEKNGNYEKAYGYHIQYAICLFRIVSKKNDYPNIQLIETKHNLDISQSKNQSLMRWILAGTLLSVILIVALFRYLYPAKKEVLKSKRETDELKKKVAESETEADESKKKICELEKEVNKLENKLLVPIKEKMSCKIIQENIKKAMIFYYSIDLRKGSISCEKFQAIVKVLIPKDEKNNMLDDINILYDKLFDRIKIRYPELTEQEFKITCMTCISFDNTVIALLLDLDKRIIERSTSEIRKKLKIEYRGDIKTFILENIE